MAPHKKIGVSRRGGLRRLEYLLRLHPSEPQDPPLDVIFVSIDVERGIIDEKSTQAPVVKEFGIAVLDTRHLVPKIPMHSTKLISTQQFSTIHSSADFKDCDFTDFQECLFAETKFVSKGNLAQTIASSLRIKDNNSLDPLRLRNIVLIGHSIKQDLKVLLRLGVNFYEVAPLVAILDTHGMSQDLLGPASCSLKDTPLMTAFTLKYVLQELKCPFKPHELHNAGNDATYTLHAMLMLAIRSSKERRLTSVEAANLEQLHLIAQAELNEGRIWSISSGLLTQRVSGQSPRTCTRETAPGVRLSAILVESLECLPITLPEHSAEPNFRQFLNSRTRAMTGREVTEEEGLDEQRQRRRAAAEAAAEYYD